MRGARANNLKDVTASIPLGTFTCVTGVSGSGKSTFTIDTLYATAARTLNGARMLAGHHETIEGLQHLDKVIDIDQSPIGRTPRSNPETYTVVVIEHNLEVIKTADWIVDLGPEGGDKGGEIVATGTPEQVVKVARSYTGSYLKPLLEARGVERVAAE